jgi:hypothetical protein
VKTSYSLVIGVAALLATITAQVQAADVSRMSFNCTNSIAAAATITANMGDALPLSAHTAVGIEHRFTGTAAATASNVITFARANTESPVTTDWETVPRLTVSFAGNGTTHVVGYTNLPVAAIGAARWIKIISIQNGDDDSVMATNSVWLIIKKGH